ncbi:MAG: choline ABC transporter permease subunit [Salibaculum sp.]|jgi:glycine betaine/proline transport system permease protein|uniref:choline ABC transporter permease subunit n=1 Tax=Roseovarius halophilus (ex Wu et al. 2025) TaxID=3376060 RepID=UPI0028708274|nr:choline ABC transporter permease subunit [Salibaculum sp.]MDR9427074.1 choline ABC transporter permease subunit [Salibaculum sp.]MDR9481927.1 choline ABC transporter permease subunit [Salibaculum sp.]
MSFLNSLLDAVVSIANAFWWCIVAAWDFLWWLIPALWWFLKWLPQRILGFTDEKLPVGETASRGFEYVRDGAQVFLDGFSVSVEILIEFLLALLSRPPGTNWIGGRGFEPYVSFWNQTTHPFVIVAGLVVLVYALQRRLTIAAFVALGFLFILDQGYWEETAESLSLVLSACVVCMAVGVPIGIAAAHRPHLYAWMRPVLDLMQTLPPFVYLIPAIVFFGIGMVPGLVATVIFVVPAPIRLTQLGIASTPLALLEAADAFGATPRQKLWKVELPSALPQIMTGLNQTIMLSLSMVVIAALVGADGLGVPVVRALNTVDTAMGFESGLVIVIVAIILDRMLRVDRK